MSNSVSYYDPIFLWKNWLQANWINILKAGKIGIIVPNYLPHPKEVGFYDIGLAENVGQTTDYGLALKDQSRLHIHEYSNGVRKIHRDEHDPDASLPQMIAHVATETKTGQAILISAVILGGMYIFTKLFRR